MIKFKKYKNSIFKTSVITLCIALILPSCSLSKNGITVAKNIHTQNTIENLQDSASVLHYVSDTSSFTENMASSDLIELVVDESTCSFAVHDTSKDTYWSALPIASGTEVDFFKQKNATVATLKILGGSDEYILNTQDNSVAYGTSSYSTTENGTVFSYRIFPDKKTAAKEQFENTDIGFELDLTTTLKDGSLRVKCTFTNITNNPNAFIEDIDLLNYFGAYSEGSAGDFLLVPDGCGAIIDTSVYDDAFTDLSFNIYGNDPSNPETTDGSAIVPSFGIKHGSSAFVTLIEGGDACAKIKAHKASSSGEFNAVYSSFNITSTKYADETIYRSNTSNTSDIVLCYRFLSGKNASYSGMASACREQLIRNSVLSGLSVNTGDYLPFFLTLTGSEAKKFSFISYQKKLTTFNQAQDMLSRMKSKGINNVFVKYTGALSGGTSYTDITKANVLSCLGSSSGLDDLYSYTSSQKMKLFLDINLLTSSKSLGSDVLSIYKKPAHSGSMFLRKINALDDVVSTVLTNFRKYKFNGFSINDIGSVLYSDYSSSGITRQEAYNEIINSIPPLSTERDTMIDNGNFFVLKSANSIINLPVTTNVDVSGAYKQIPFVQLILHGIVDYSGSPINQADNQDEMMLNCIEYGACPHYSWNYISDSDDPLTDNLYYDNTINSASEFYEKANSALGDLRDARMTEHYEVADGIFCTEYDTGTIIYVNYTDKDYSTLGVVVESRNFLRIN